MSTISKITTVFYSHAWSIYCLDQLNLTALDKSIVFELGRGSTLAPVFDRQGVIQLGIVGLLHDSERLPKMIEKFDQVAAPVVFSPRPVATPASLGSALGVVKHIESDYEHAIVMVHLSDVVFAASGLIHSDEFVVAWDAQDPFTTELVHLGRVLKSRALLTDSNWRGIRFYNSEKSKHNQQSKAEREQILDEAVKEFPALKNAVGA